MTTCLLIAGGKAAEISIPRDKPSSWYGEVGDAFQKAANTRDYVYWIRWPAEQAAGVPFIWDLAGSGGAAFQLIAMPDTTREQIDAAKTWLRNQRDVVSLRVLRVNEVITFTPPK